MTTGDFRILDKVIPADVLQISLTPDGITQIPYLLVLIQHKYLHASPIEHERLREIYRAKEWLWDGVRVIEVTITDTFERTKLEKALDGFIEKPLRRKRPQEETGSNLPPRGVGKARESSRVAEPIDLEKIHDILEIGLDRRELAEALKVSTKGVGGWCRRWKAGLNQVESHSVGVTEALAVLHDTLIGLERAGIDRGSIIAWWNNRSTTLDDKRPCRVFQEGQTKRRLVQQVATQLQTELCPV